MIGKQLFLSVLTLHQIITQELMVWELTKVPNHLRVFGYYYLCLNMEKKKKKKKKKPPVFPNHFFPVWMNPLLFARESKDSLSKCFYSWPHSFLCPFSQDSQS